MPSQVRLGLQKLRLFVLVGEDWLPAQFLIVVVERPARRPTEVVRGPSFHLRFLGQPIGRPTLQLSLPGFLLARLRRLLGLLRQVKVAVLPSRVWFLPQRGVDRARPMRR